MAYIISDFDKHASEEGEFHEFYPAVERKTEKELLYWLEAALAWIDAVPSDTQLPAMPGFDREVVDVLIDDIKQGRKHESLDY